MFLSFVGNKENCSYVDNWVQNMLKVGYKNLG